MHQRGRTVGEQPVSQDYYSVLGIAPAAKPSEIRAAYRSLMRRFHPDADPGSEAAERSREINAAYSVLNSPEKRSAYDATLAEHRQIRFEPVSAPEEPASMRKRVAAAGAILIAALAAGMIGYALYPSISAQAPAAIQWEIEAPPELAVMKPPPKPEPSCASSTVNDLVKRELFRRAALRRPDVEAQLREVETATVVRFAAKEAESRSGDCGGWFSLDVPSDFAVDGGRTNLNADIAFGLTRAGASLRLASLTGDDRLVRSLASIGPAPKEPSPTEVEADTVISASNVPQRAAASAKPRPAPFKPARVRQADASTPCAGVAGRTERMLCANANLALLDRQVSSFYRQSWSQADEQKRSELLRTRQSFDVRRDACSTSNCMTSAYVSRLRQISEIMAGRAQP